MPGFINNHKRKLTSLLLFCSLGTSALKVVSVRGQKSNKPKELHAAKSQKEKISPDLKFGRRSATANSGDGINNTIGEEMVRVIVQFEDAASAKVLRKESVLKGKMRDVLEHFGTQVVEVRASEVEALAELSGVTYVSRDRPLASTGHLTTTTGVDEMRSAIAANKGFDGAGVGIAIIDSGIDPTHRSFAEAPANAAADETRTLTDFEATFSGDNYGSRIRGYLIAPTTGKYTFWLASNDNGALYLSTDNNPANKRLIASVSTYTNKREWTRFPSQRSASLDLIAGNRYYIEAWQKEDTGSDHLAVAWRKPEIIDATLTLGTTLTPGTTLTTNTTPEEIIPASALAAFTGKSLTQEVWTDVPGTSIATLTGVSRLKANLDFTGKTNTADDTGDPYGHGTHVASLAAGNDRVSDAYRGIAPGANILSLRALDAQGNGTTSSVLSALYWVLLNARQHNIRVVNLSLGAPAVDSYKTDPLCRAARMLVASGIVVVAAAGNDGKSVSGQKIYGQIHSPGNEPSVITVGASNTYGTDYRGDDTVTTYSSRGPTRSYREDEAGVIHYDHFIKPDLVAPGNKLIAAQAQNNFIVAQDSSLSVGYDQKAHRRMMYMSGTSMATPVVAGTVALMLQANPNLSPGVVKAILSYTAQPIVGFNMFEQGAGGLNARGAIELARLVRTDLAALSSPNTRMLTGRLPEPQSWIAGSLCPWSQGIIAESIYASGTALITNYQKIYSAGVLFGDGVVLGDGLVMGDKNIWSDGVVFGDHIMTSSGVIMGDGLRFMPLSNLTGDGALMGDGVVLGDGVVMGDRSRAESISIEGDNTSYMQP